MLPMIKEARGGLCHCRKGELIVQSKTCPMTRRENPVETAMTIAMKRKYLLDSRRGNLEASQSVTEASEGGETPGDCRLETEVAQEDDPDAYHEPA